MEQNAYIDEILKNIWAFAPNALIAVALLVGGLWLIRRVTLAFRSFLSARKIDESLRPFFVSLVDVGMKVALILMVAGRLGFETTSFIAIFSALAFAIGLALQGSLGNFASGVLILLFRPYKVGDMLTVEGKMGHVTEIQIFNTILTTPDGRKLIIPNGKMTEGTIESITAEGEVRADVIVHIKDYSSIPTMRQAALKAIQACPHAIPGKPAFVEISGFPRDAMMVIVGCWTTGAHYWDTFYLLHEELKKNFDAVGIEMAQEDYEDVP